jgi:hypothetical protein
MASQSGEFNVQQFNDLGDPLIGGRLYTYAYGTTTQKTAYTDPAGAVPHTYTSDGLGGQYIALNARGELPAPLYLGNGPYDLTLKTAAGATIWTRRAQGTLIASNIIPVQLASAATVDIGGQGVTSIEITGNTNISSFGTNYAGPIFVRFLGSLTLVHNSVTLNLPGGTNSTVNPGDIVIASGNSNNNGWNVLVVSQNSFAKTGVNNDITALTALATVPTVIATAIAAGANATPTVRQTVLNGPVDTNGFASFGGSTGGTTVTASGTLTATAANGTANRTGSIANPSWTSLSTNGTMYLYLDIAADGTCTAGSTTLAPTYRWGGADVTATNQFTFNIQEMVGKVGNGTTAAQVWRVFVGEVTVSGGVVTAIAWYALMGRYQSPWTATLPAASAAVSFNHNIGTVDLSVKLEVQCTTAEFGYSVGDTVTEVNGNTGGVAAPISVVRTSRAVGFTVSNTGSMLVLNKTTGANATMTLASWRYRMTAQRGW